MSSRCPDCGALTVEAQDIETFSNATLLVKLEKRIQLCCQQCGWMAFDDPCIQDDPEQAQKRR